MHGTVHVCPGQSHSPQRDAVAVGNPVTSNEPHARLYEQVLNCRSSR